MRGERRKYRVKGPDDEEEGRMLLLKIDEGGHGGNSGTYSFLEDLAFEYAFIITSLEASIKPIYTANMTGFSWESSNFYDEELSRKRVQKKKHKEEEEYRRGGRSKGDRGQNKLVSVEWVARLFVSFNGLPISFNLLPFLIIIT